MLQRCVALKIVVAIVPSNITLKREIRHFHVVVVQKRERHVQKSVMHVRSYFFAY